uniref:Cadherin domain-containing protein n=1 Tax=Megaselia scalaris TaxID=36166 RepID=T1GSZ7_MEGSC
MQYSQEKMGYSSCKVFNLIDLSTDKIKYVHNGAENSDDHATIDLQIYGDTSHVPHNFLGKHRFLLHANITAVNDPPILQIPQNKILRLIEGIPKNINNDLLTIFDPDSPPHVLIYTVLPTNDPIASYGRFELNGKYTLTFSQADVNAGKVTYIFNNTMADSTSYQIQLQVSDGIETSEAVKNEISFFVNDGLFNTSDQILEIYPKPVVVTEVHNENLHVFPLTKKQVLRDHLQYMCSDESREIKYNITISPSLGRLLYEDYESGISKEISEFTQEDISEGRIFYEHTAVMHQFRINDSFYFDVIGDKAERLLDQKFNIEISVSSGGLLRFLPVSKVEVEEGDSAPIKLDFSKILEYLNSRAGISNPELYIESIQTPSFGKVELVDDITHTTRFHTSDFATGKVIYSHDHSDTLEDTILMSVFLVQGRIFLCNLTIPVSITPVNDQPFVLMTQTPHMTVWSHNWVFNEDISSRNAQEIIIYSNQFTQADINNDRIMYVHYGPPQSTTFYFNVSDGQYKPAYEIFNIKVAPITIIPHEDFVPISVQQGATSSVLRTSNLGFRTNAQLSRVQYNISNSPLHGIMLLDHQPTLRFTQQQLENGQITYMQTNMNKSNDTFQLVAYIPDTVYGTSMDVKVVIEPVLNKTNPKFVIYNPPKQGSIRKIIRSSGDNEAHTENIRSITVFTYKELKSGVIFYVTNSKPKLGQTDSFEYNLLIKSVQPAQSLVKIEYRIEDDMNEPTVMMSSPNLNFNYIAIIFLLIGIIVLIFVVLLMLKLRNVMRKKNLKQKDHPPSLPCPPDLTSSVGPIHNYASSEIDSMPVTAASTPIPGFSNIPHCKVIPVENFKNVDYSEYLGDMMGVEDDEEDDMDDPGETQQMVPNSNRYNNTYLDQDGWSSSCDMGNDFGYASVQQNLQTPNSNNPLLRKNQYWV